MRLAYIKLKDVVAEKQDAIASLDLIGDGLHLMDYEQLKGITRTVQNAITLAFPQCLQYRHCRLILSITYDIIAAHLSLNFYS